VKLLALVVVIALSVGVLPAESYVEHAWGGGYVTTKVDSDADLDGDGIYLMWRALHRGEGWIFTADVGALFAYQFSSGFFIEEEVVRSSATIGYSGRRDKSVRPFIFGGLSLFRLEEFVTAPASTGFPFAIRFIDDYSAAPVIGVGFEGGSGRHNFYANITRDFGHEVSVEDSVLGPIPDSEFDLTTIHVGYLYRLRLTK